jgi:hypothetical protein
MGTWQIDVFEENEYCCTVRASGESEEIAKNNAREYLKNHHPPDIRLNLIGPVSASPNGKNVELVSYRRKRS